MARQTAIWCQLYGWILLKNKPDPANQDIRELYTPGALYRNFQVGGQKLVTLTYDDGPWPTNTLAIANTLRNNDLDGVATFFKVADNVSQFREIAE